MFTDDPGTPGDRKWEINTSTYSELNKESIVQLPLIDLNYGYKDNMQLKLEVPYVLSERNDQKIRSNVGYILPGVKYRFADPDRNFVAASFYPQVTIAIDKHYLNEYELPFQFEKEFKNFTIDYETGYAIRPADADYILNGILVGINHANMELMCELYMKSPPGAIIKTNGLINIGIRYTLSSKFILLGAMGTEVINYDSDDRTAFSYIGLRWCF